MVSIDITKTNKDITFNDITFMINYFNTKLEGNQLNFQFWDIELYPLVFKGYFSFEMLLKRRGYAPVFKDSFLQCVISLSC